MNFEPPGDEVSIHNGVDAIVYGGIVGKDGFPPGVQLPGEKGHDAVMIILQGN